MTWFDGDRSKAQQMHAWSGTQQQSVAGRGQLSPLHNPHLVLGGQGTLGTLGLAAQLLRQPGWAGGKGEHTGMVRCWAAAAAATAMRQCCSCSRTNNSMCVKLQQGWCRSATLELQQTAETGAHACSARMSVDTSFLYLRFTSLMKYLAGRKEGGQREKCGSMSEWRACRQVARKQAAGMLIVGNLCSAAGASALLLPPSLRQHAFPALWPQHNQPSKTLTPSRAGQSPRRPGGCRRWWR